MYYYTWEFFTSIGIIALVAAYIICDRIKINKEKKERQAADAKK